MKLKDVKNSIDNFFENITPDELAKISIEELGAAELIDLGEQKIRINFNKKVVEKFEGIAIHFINNEAINCLYLPSINLLSEGKDLKEAQNNLHIALVSYFENLMKLSKSNIQRKLEYMGWTKDNYFEKKLRYLEPLNSADVKKRFDLSEDTNFSPLKIAV